MMERKGGKNSILSQILEIDREIKRITRDSTYRKITKTLDMLNNDRFGRRNIIIPSPDDLDSNIEIRKHSQELREVIEKYQIRRDAYKEKLTELHTRRRELKRKLFG
jgi:hypothetical protein